MNCREWGKDASGIVDFSSSVRLESIPKDVQSSVLLPHFKPTRGFPCF